ncbi:MAG: hypothetical protein AAB642_03065 [Patescibacteria group bacterium]
MEKIKNAFVRVAAPATAWALGAAGALAQDVTVPGGTAPPVITPKTVFDKTSLLNTLSGLLTYILVFVSIVAVAMILYGAWQYITAGADDTKVGKAKTTLLWGVIGVIVAALSYAIVSFASSLVLKGS